MSKLRSALAAIGACALILTGCAGGHHHPRALAGCPGYVTAYGCQAHSQTFGLPPKGQPQRLGPTVTPTVGMVDSANAAAYPLSAFSAAGYTSGFFITYPFIVAHFRYHVSIAVNAAHTRDNFGRPIRCLDVEPGDASPSQAGPWDRQIIAIGGRPCDYENASTLPAVQASIRAAGLRVGVDVDEWVADWTGFPFLYPGSAATQWIDHGPQGQNYDQSVVTPAFLGIQPPPTFPLCFSHRIPAKSCAAVKAKIASDRRAAASSERALAATGRVLARNRCVKPYRRGVCIHKGRDAALFAQRARFFTAAAGRLTAAS